MLQSRRAQRQTPQRIVAALTATALAASSAVLITGASALAATSAAKVWVVTAPTTAATTQAVSIARLDANGASTDAAIVLPTAVDGQNRPFTLGGTETNTGVLARSLDGRYVTLAGYAVAPGSSVSTSVTRGVARVDATGTVDTSTTLSGALIKSAVRGAVTNDGTSVWASGDGDDSSPKRSVVHQQLGASAAPSAIWSSDDDQYKKKGGPIKAYGGAFWFASDNKGALYRVVGPPDTPTSASLTSIASTTALDYAFVDRDASIPGVDTLYVAVSSGIEKWATVNGSTWSKVGTSALPGVRSLDARSAGDRSEIFAVVGTSSANTLHKITDVAAPAAAANLTDTTIATAPAGASYRAVSFAPTANGAAPDSVGTTPTVAVTPPSGVSVGDSVTYAAAVSAGGTTATSGSVTFYDGTTVLGTAAVSPSTGIAKLNATQTLGGSRSITAWYSGSDDLLPITSQATTTTIGRLTTTTTVTPDSLAADYSATATALTISVAGTAEGVTPAGSVTLTEDGATVGTGTLASGSVKIGLTALTSGTHNLVASYGGSDSFAPSTAAAVAVRVDRAATTTVITASSAPVALGSTLNATIAVANTVNSSSAYRATGTVDVLEGSTVVASGTLSSGSANVTIPASALTTGNHTLTGRYNGSANHSGSTSTTALPVTVASSTVSALTLTPSSGTIYFGQQQVTVKGTVAGLPGGGASPVGTVELRHGVVGLGQVPVDTNGGFTFVLPADQAAGSYSLTAYYSGDSTYTASQSATKSLTISAGGSTLTTTATLALSAPKIAPGDPIRATATVSNSSSSAALTGFVRFSVDGVPVGDAKVTAVNPATTPPTATAFVDLDSNLAEGGHTITAKYLGAGTSGSVGFRPSDAASATLTLEAAEAVDTSVTISQPTANNPVTYGTANAVTISVTPVGGGDKTVTGTVELRDGDKLIGSGLLSGGELTLSMAGLLPGEHRLTAAYIATGSFNASQSAGDVVVRVVAASTSTTVTLATSAVLYGTGLKPKVTVSNLSGTGVVPTGTVSILEGSTLLTTGSLTSGTTTLTLPTTLTSGNHSLRAVYTPGSGFAASESDTDVSAIVVGTSLKSTGFNPSEFYIGSAKPAATFTVTSLEPGRGIPTGVVAVYTSSSPSTAALLGYGTLDGTGQTTITMSAEVPRSGASIDDDKLKYKSIIASYSGVGTSSPIEDISTTVGGYDDDSVEIKFKGVPVATSTTLTLNNAELAPDEAATAHVSVTGADGSTPSGGYVQVLVDPDANGAATALFPACFTALRCVEIPVTNGVADVTLPVLPAGDHTITARHVAYQGSKSSIYYAASVIGADNSAAIHVDATKATAQVSLTVPNVEAGARSIAKVAVIGTAGDPAGTVEVFEGSKSLGQATLAEGQVQIDLGALAVGLHPLKARYSGAGKYDAADSAQVQHSVFGHPVKVSATAVSACRYGTPCTVKVAVSAGVGVPIGTVRLLEAGNELATAGYSGTSVTLKTKAKWSVGTHHLTAVFSPTSDHTAGGAAKTISVAKAASKSRLRVSKSKVRKGASITATASVTAIGVAPQGTVRLYDGKRYVGKGVLRAGKVTFTVRKLTRGAHRLTVRYLGSSTTDSATSAVVVVKVK